MKTQLRLESLRIEHTTCGVTEPTTTCLHYMFMFFFYHYRTNRNSQQIIAFLAKEASSVLLCGFETELMSLQTATKSRNNALEGIHGVHVVSPFSYDRTTQVGDFQTNCKSSEMGTNQRLFIKYVHDRMFLTVFHG